MDRLKSHQEFVAVLRKRRKYSGRDIVAHYLVRSDASPDAGETSMTNSHASKRLGLAVSKAVGNAVTRNTVKRRFRVAAAKHEHRLPDGCDVVLRAKPSAATASFASLDDQIESAFTRIGQHPEGRPKSAHASGNASRRAARSDGADRDADR